MSTSLQSVSHTPLARYLGAARVVRQAGDAQVVVLEDGTVVHATLALTFPYHPRVGDKLLVIGDAHAFWVIGVLDGRGRTDLSRRGGVVAESGVLRLRGDRGLKLAGGRVSMHAQRLSQFVVQAVRTVGEFRTHVREQQTLEAGEVDELSQGRWLMQARRVVLKSLYGARIKSTTVRLG